MNKKPLAVVLGCGPSGLIAAHALSMYGVPFAIFSKKQKSVLGGAQFSHQGLIGVHDVESPEVMLTYQVVGDPEEYQRKVYGDNPVPFVSFSNVSEGKQVPAWNLLKLYDTLWEKYEDRIVDIEMTHDRMDKFEEAFDLVINSVPAPLVCKATMDPSVGHWFRQQTVRIYNEALDDALPDNTIRYDGTKDHSYYRMSRIFGVGSTEWGASSPLPPINPIRTINKPVATNCDCNPRVLRVGRFGTWSKGVLTFQSYNDVVEQLEEWGISR